MKIRKFRMRIDSKLKGKGNKEKKKGKENYEKRR